MFENFRAAVSRKKTADILVELADEQAGLSVDPDVCSGCGICYDECTKDVIEIIDCVSTIVNLSACDSCGDCTNGCPTGAITLD